MLIDPSGRELESHRLIPRLKKRWAASYKIVLSMAGVIAVIATLVTNITSIGKLLGIGSADTSAKQILPSQVQASQSQAIQPPVGEQYLTPNYMRLFGAVEVPLLMDMIGKKLDFHKDINNSVPELNLEYYSDSNSGLTISKELVDFWQRSWKYHDARPLQTLLWSRFVSHAFWDINTYYSALSPTVADLFTFSRCTQVDEVGDLPDEIASTFNKIVKESWYDNPPGTETKDIGYLFVILENTSTETLTDIELSFLEYSNPLRIRNFREDQDEGRLYKLSWVEPRSVALTDAEMQKMSGKSASIKIASAAPHEAFIWLLGIYRANDDGLPEFYLTDVQVPVEATFSVKGVRKKAAIRKPYLLQAARVVVPNGWFCQ